MTTYYIGADVDSKMTNLAVMDKNGKVQPFVVPTTIPTLRAVLRSISGRKQLVIEEGTMSGWLYRNLRDDVDDFTVCDPRRNALIYKDGTKTDPIDAMKLAELCRNNQLRPVYHSTDEDRILFKRWVSLYHDRVREAVRQASKLRSICLSCGLRLSRKVFQDVSFRAAWLETLDEELRKPFELLLIGYDAASRQRDLARDQLVRFSRRYAIIDNWCSVPGIGLIRAATFFVWIDTPFRFKRPKPLWKYCGVGLNQYSSGKDNDGQPRKGKVRLAWAVNRQLKNVVMGAAKSAIAQKQNVFYCYYERMVNKGVRMSNARHAVARKLASVMWGMWKTSRRFDASLVFDESGV